MEEASNTERTPYLFTSKELDKETGLYYVHARYYDPRTSVWQSPDPILASYLTGKPNGGVTSSINLNLYNYTLQNPLKFIDPTGTLTEDYDHNDRQRNNEPKRYDGTWAGHKQQIDKQKPKIGKAVSMSLVFKEELLVEGKSNFNPYKAKTDKYKGISKKGKNFESFEVISKKTGKRVFYIKKSARGKVPENLTNILKNVKSKGGSLKQNKNSFKLKKTIKAGKGYIFEMEDIGIMDRKRDMYKYIRQLKIYI